MSEYKIPYFTAHIKVALSLVHIKHHAMKAWSGDMAPLILDLYTT
jgi:hypothetical protein